MMTVDVEPTQTEIDQVSAAMQKIYDDPIARGSGFICAKILKRTFIDLGWMPPAETKHD